ncbi:serine hydrolase [Agromyces sp. LHK192]|uniref:serine hydrolase domain-containing protein n=1 Tax=Agromyces sp. LHK192 TaxID=2498704 RepID=UPI000FDC1648|nr:serine hydrolase domain-containing protein [Agromyces sp. LHK192]
MRGSKPAVAGSSASAVAIIVALAVALLGGCVGETSNPASTPPPSDAAVASAAPFDPALREQLDTVLDEGFEASGMPGVAVGLWIPGHEEWVATRGVSDVDAETPMDRANQSKIGSITKTIVGQAALQVIGDGSAGLSLDDTIDRWYPDFPEAGDITVRMLMNMSSGIGEPGQAQLDRICGDPYSMITPDEMIAIGATTPRADFAPGEGMTYSGYNTFLLGRILEQTTGSELGTLIEDRLLMPLGMTRSRFAPDAVLDDPFNHGYSEFCPLWPRPTDTTDWTNHESWAAGAMLSTLDDLHLWGLAFGEGFGLSPELRAARIEDRAPVEVAPGYWYGLGANVHLDPESGCLLDLNHSGTEPGYGAHVQYFEGSGAVLALIGNGDGGTGHAFNEVLLPIVQALPESVAATSSTACVSG